MMKNELKFKIRSNGGANTYIISNTNSNLRNFWYLRRDGTLHRLLRGREDYFNSPEEARQFLNRWSPKGVWLAKGYVKYKAEQGDKEALDCSIEHWKQIVLAGRKKYRYNNLSQKVGMEGDYCALCKRRAIIGRVCSEACPLKSCGNDTAWDKASSAIWSTKADFTEKTIDMLNHLVRIRNKLYGNPVDTFKRYESPVFDTAPKSVPTPTFSGLTLKTEEKPFWKKKSEASKKMAAKEMTVKEIGEKLGYDVKVVKESVKKEPEVVAKHGDILEDSRGVRLVVIKVNGRLESYPNNVGSVPVWPTRPEDLIKHCNYKIVGNVFKN
jgi:hypothetical protein